MDLSDYIKPAPADNTPRYTDLGHSYQDRYQYAHTTQDSGLWLELFWLAHDVDRYLAEKLEYIRAVGAYLVLDQQWGFAIKPIVGPAGWDSLIHYNTERQWLVPHTQTMIRALAELRRRYDAKTTF